MIVVGITGASGVIYGIRLLEALKELEIENSLVISDAAKIVIESETDYTVEDVINIADTYYDFNDLTDEDIVINSPWLWCKYNNKSCRCESEGTQTYSNCSS